MAFRSSMLLAGFLTLEARLLIAQAPPEVMAAESFGPRDQELYVGAYAFRPRHHWAGVGAKYYVNYGSGYLRRLGGDDGTFLAPLTLPGGAQIQALCLYADDHDSSGTVSVRLDAVKLPWAGASSGVVPIGPLLETYWDFGHGVVCADIVPPYTYRESGDVDGDGLVEHVAHRLVANIGGTDEDLGFGGVGVFWRRQVSPAPAAATFTDVPTTHDFFQFVEALAASDITAGCGGGNFCPDSPLTRGQMAVFLAKALGLHWPY